MTKQACDVQFQNLKYSIWNFLGPNTNVESTNLLKLSKTKPEPAGNLSTMETVSEHIFQLYTNRDTDARSTGFPSNPRRGQCSTVIHARRLLKLPL